MEQTMYSIPIFDVINDRDMEFFDFLVYAMSENSSFACEPWMLEMLNDNLSEIKDFCLKVPMYCSHSYVHNWQNSSDRLLHLQYALRYVLLALKDAKERNVILEPSTFKNYIKSTMNRPLETKIALHFLKNIEQYKDSLCDKQIDALKSVSVSGIAQGIESAVKFSILEEALLRIHQAENEEQWENARCIPLPLLNKLISYADAILEHDQEYGRQII